MLAYVMEGPGKGTVAEVPDPEIGDHDALVEMVACGICSSTDKMLRLGTFRGGVDYPSVLGHESVGRVVKRGSRVRHIEVGALVTRASAYRPGRTPNGLQQHWGGLAEFGVVTDWQALQEDQPAQPASPTFSQVFFPPATDPESVALGISFSETFSVICPVPVLRRKVGVVGTGIAGLSFVAYAKLLGAGMVMVVGRRPERLELARRLGADIAVLESDGRPEAVAGDLGGLDVVFEASGAAAMVGRAYGWLRRGGREVVYSAPEDLAALDLMTGPRDATVTVASTDESAVLPGVVRMVDGGVLDKDAFLTHRYPLTDITTAFSDIARGDVVKAVVTFS